MVDDILINAEFKYYLQNIIDARFPSAMSGNQKMFVLIELLDIEPTQIEIEFHSVNKDGRYKWIMTHHTTRIRGSMDSESNYKFKLSI